MLHFHYRQQIEGVCIPFIQNVIEEFHGLWWPVALRCTPFLSIKLHKNNSKWLLQTYFFFYSHSSLKFSKQCYSSLYSLIHRQRLFWLLLSSGNYLASFTPTPLIKVKLSLCTTEHYTMNNIFFTSGLVGGEWSSSCSCHFTPRGQSPPVPIG
jgi:hypothetical protein